MMAIKGELFILTAPSGGGKTTLAKILLEKLPNIHRIITCTTRPLRPGEQHGQDYFFLSLQEFERMRERNSLLEWAQVHGHYYGTPREQIERLLSQGEKALLIIDWQGARQVKKQIPAARTIFIRPPSLEELERRLRERNTEASEEMTKRLQDALHDVTHAGEFEHVIINEDLAKAADQLLGIMRGEL